MSVLRTLVRSCNFGALEESLLRDRIVMGINVDATRRKLLQSRNLSLQSAIDICRTRELASRQMKEIQPGDSVHKVSEGRLSRKEERKKIPSQSRGREPSINKDRSVKNCKFCGKKHEFQKELCPAYGKDCRKCGKKKSFLEHV